MEKCKELSGHNLPKVEHEHQIPGPREQLCAKTDLRKPSPFGEGVFGPKGEEGGSKLT